MSNSVIQSNLALIIDKQKEIEQYRQIFIKNYQQELKFILSIIEEDAQRMQFRSYCCSSLCSKLSFFKNNRQPRQQFYNPLFYDTFTQMSVAERQSYFIQLHDYIEYLYQLYQKEIRNHPNPQIDPKQYKSLVATKLINNFINAGQLKKIEEFHMNFELKIELDDNIYYKNAKFKSWKLHLIEQHLQAEKKIVIDFRNYLVIDSYQEENQQVVRLKTIYETIFPENITIMFKHDEVEFFNTIKYYQMVKEIIKIGKIERLILNIDQQKIFEGIEIEEVQPERFELMQTFLKKVSSQSQQSNRINSEDIIRETTVKHEIKLKKMETLKLIQYEQNKQKLIQTLNFLAEKKQKEQQMVVKFYTKKIAPQKVKNERIERVMSNPQSIILRRENNQETNTVHKITIDNVVKAIVKQNIQCLSVINDNRQGLNQNKSQKDHFYNDSQDDNNFHHKFNKDYGQNKNIKKIKYKQNIYYKLYPNNAYKLDYVETLVLLIKMDFSEHLYVASEDYIQKEANGLKGQKLATFRAQWIDKIKSNCKIYCQKENPNFMKIIIPMTVETKSLLQAIINIEAYPKWHPNIKNIEILKRIDNQNAIIYSLQIKNPLLNETSKYTFLMSLFKLDNKYYIIQKSVDSNQQKLPKWGFLSFLNVKKKDHKRLNFLLIKVQALRDGRSQISITLEIEADQNKKNQEKRRKQYITFFSNYFLIVKYWSKNEKQQSISSLFNLDWTVSPNSIDSQYQQNSKSSHNSKCFNEQNGIEMISQYKKDTTSQLIRSQQYYDL